MKPASDKQRGPTKILIAEDSDLLAVVMERHLIDLGCEVDREADAHAALRRASNKTYDALITDHELSNSYGLDLVRKLRSQGFTGKIIVYCSPLRSKDEADYRSIGVDGILFKPCTGDELLKILLRAGLEWL